MFYEFVSVDIRNSFKYFIDIKQEGNRSVIKALSFESFLKIGLTLLVFKIVVGHGSFILKF